MAIAGMGRITATDAGDVLVPFAWVEPAGRATVERLAGLTEQGSLELAAGAMRWHLTLPRDAAHPRGGAALLIDPPRGQGCALLFRLPQHLQLFAVVYVAGELVVYARQPTEDDVDVLPRLVLRFAGRDGDVAAVLARYREIGLAP